MRLRWPTGVGRAVCFAAVVVAAGSAVGHGPAAGRVAAAGVAVVAVWRRPAFAVLLLVSLGAGMAASARAAPQLPPGVDTRGSITLNVVALTDPAPAERGWSFVARADGGPMAGHRVAVSTQYDPAVPVGARVEVIGRLVPRSGRLHRNPIAGHVTARSIAVVGLPSGPIAAANALRGRVREQFPATRPTGALMRGFLIGDTSAIDAITLENMRRAGLLHFVAVSGGNVAIFLAGVWLLFGVVPLSPRVRAAIGLLGIVLFVLVTRWEPSVLRAGVMLGLLLAGRIGGVPVDGWTALGAAATLLLLAAPQLVFDVGFQLSALATGGLLLGSHLWTHRRPAVLWMSLGATLAAQAAVTPLLIWRFGSVPAFSAVANVAAAPLVTLGTAAGWGRVFTGVPGLDNLADAAAGAVVDVANWAGRLPQVGWVGLIVVAAAVVLLRWRSSLGLAAVAVALFATSLTPEPPAVATAVFLDVGQGDAALLLSERAGVVAIDTGPDPIVYLDALRRHGVRHIDLLVLTHSDADHVGGLDALGGRVTVDEVWFPDFTSPETWNDLLSHLGATEVRPVAEDHQGTMGEFRLAALGPGRRFAADNDGSVVIWVEVNGSSLLLAGDIEGVAQNELPPLAPDVMLVPHHGSTTSDVDWLARTAGHLAVLSYGENSFGHPAVSVTDTLDAIGSQVRRTEHGDVVVRFPAFGQITVAAGLSSR